MAKRHIRQKSHESNAARFRTPTQKQALAAALNQLGPSASAAAIARFVKKQCGLNSTFYMLMPKTAPVK